MTACGYEHSAKVKYRYLVGDPVDFEEVTLCMDNPSHVINIFDTGYRSPESTRTCFCVNHSGQHYETSS